MDGDGRSSAGPAPPTHGCGWEAEGALVRAPLEALKAAVRERAREAAQGLDRGLAVLSAPDHGASAAVAECERVLTGVKRRLDALAAKESEHAARAQRRVARLRVDAAELDEPGGGGAPFPRAFERQRVDRLVADFLMRDAKAHAVGVALAESAGVAGDCEQGLLVDAHAVADALRAGSDAKGALAWCEANRTKLTKRGSGLEFRLRAQQLVELARAGRRVEAVEHARKHLAPHVARHLPELQRAMAALVVRDPERPPAPYAELFDPEHWARLADEFMREFLALNGLPQPSLLAVHLQAGLSALKVTNVPAESSNPEDPLHHGTYAALAMNLPSSKHIHSKLVCHITKAFMNENNPPMVLPNGYVYSRNAMEAMARRNNRKVTCVRTGQGPYNFSELQKAFLA